MNFAFWHSATFNNAGTKVVFTDELGGGSGAHCNAATGPTKGADAIYDIVGRGDKPHAGVQELLQDPADQRRHRELRGAQRLADPGHGPRHHGPGVVPGRRLGLGLHQLGAPVEIGYWERGPVSATALTFGGSWSAYYYNGYIYSNDRRAWTS